MKILWLFIVLVGAGGSQPSVGKEHSDNTEPDKLSSDSEEILETFDYKEAYPLEDLQPKKFLVDSMNHFTTTLLSKLFENQKLSGNILFSPLSSHVALSMLLNGADGDTKNQLKKGLGLHFFTEDGVKNLDSEYHDVLEKLNSTEHVRLESANRVFLAKEASSEFNEAFQDTFGDKPSVVNFKDEPEITRSIINQFVENKTHGKIQNLIPKEILKPNTAFVIINALYFKGSWENKFDKKLTSKEPFYLTVDDKVSVDMMKMKKPIKAVFRKMESFSAKVLKLPYDGQRMSMILILPEERHQLKIVGEKIKTMGMKKLVEDFEEVAKDNKTVSVKIFLPKFKSKKTLRLNGPLKQLGMTDMFSRRANFQKMLPDKGETMKVSEVLQKIYLSVYEEGSEAASATAAVGSFFKSATISNQFKCDEPFLFLLKDDLTKIILFAGKIVNPSLAD